MNSIDRCLARSGAAIVTVMLGSAVCHAQTNQTQGSDQSTTAKTAIAANKTRPGTPSTKASGSKASKSATGATDDSPKAMEYDPKMAKSADLRRQYEKSPHTGTVSSGSLKIDHSRMVDFINIMPKRSDLRLRVA